MTWFAAHIREQDRGVPDEVIFPGRHASIGPVGVADDPKGADELPVLFRQLRRGHFQQLAEELPVRPEFGREIPDILLGWLFHGLRKQGLIERQVMGEQCRKYRRPTDRRRSPRPPDMQPILGRALTGVVVALTLRGQRGRGQPSLQERRLGLDEAVHSTPS